VNNERIRRFLAKSEDWKKLIVQDRSTFQTLSRQGDDIKGAFTECLAIGSDGISSTHEMELYMNELLLPIHSHFHELLTRSDFDKIYKNAEFMFRVSYYIEKLRGVARASTPHNYTFIWKFFNIGQIFEKIVSLMDRYHTYQNMANLCLQFFKDVTSTLQPYLTGQQCRQLFMACLECIKTYRKYNSGRSFTGRYAREAEEEQFTDILALLQILTEMTSREFLDFGAGEDKVDISEVVFQGMNHVLPLITLEILDVRNSTYN
jgi:hypothetical protein